MLSNALVFSLVTILGVIVADAVYCTLISPLRKLPNAHPSVPFGPFWILWHRWRGSEVFAVNNAYQKFGSIVRIGPREVAINDMPNGIAVVYGSPGYEKTDWYDFFINYGRRNAFSMHGVKEHSLVRKLSSRVYSKSFVANSSHLMKNITGILFGRYLPLIQESVEAERTIDILPVNVGSAIDIMTAFTFGLARGTNLTEDAEERERWIGMHRESHIPLPMFWLLEFPLLSMFIAPFLSALLAWQKGRSAFEDWAQDRISACDIALEDVDHFESLPTGQAPLLYGQIKHSIIRSISTSEPEIKVPVLSDETKLDIASEVLDHVHAMRDTFGMAVTYGMYAMCLLPKTQQHSYNELKAGLPNDTFEALRNFDDETFTSFATDHNVSAQLESLPYLNGVIKEAWRLRNTYPTPNPRVVPSGPDGGHVELCGFEIPKGTRVASFAWSAQRVGEVFADPELFAPDRWIQNNAEKIKQMEQWTWAFGSGNRGCPGQHLAFQMIRFILAATFIRYTCELVDDSNYGVTNSFCKADGSDSLLVKFHSRTH